MTIRLKAAPLQLGNKRLVRCAGCGFVFEQHIRRNLAGIWRPRNPARRRGDGHREVGRQGRQLIETRERFILTKEKDFRKPFGYAADLRSEGKDFPAKRVDDALNLSGVTYKIVAIGKDELVVSAPNQVRTTIAAVPAQ